MKNQIQYNRDQEQSFQLLGYVPADFLLSGDLLKRLVRSVDMVDLVREPRESVMPTLWIIYQRLL